jgi:hypothetical protein
VTGPVAEPVKPAPRGLMAIGAAGLVFEAVVMLLAIPAVTTAQRGHLHVAGVVYLAVLAVVLVLIAGGLRRPGGVTAGSVVQVFVIAAGVVTWPMFVVGAIFAAIWAYWLQLRRTSG